MTIRLSIDLDRNTEGVQDHQGFAVGGELHGQILATLENATEFMPLYVSFFVIQVSEAHREKQILYKNDLPESNRVQGCLIFNRDKPPENLAIGRSIGEWNQFNPSEPDYIQPGLEPNIPFCLFDFDRRIGSNLPEELNLDFVLDGVHFGLVPAYMIDWDHYDPMWEFTFMNQEGGLQPQRAVIYIYTATPTVTPTVTLTPTVTPTRIPNWDGTGDLNRDDQLNFLDWWEFSLHYRQLTGPGALPDFDHDGIISATDALQLQMLFRQLRF